MNAAWLAAAWAGIGIIAGLGPARFRRPIALIAPLLLVALTIATAQGGARPGGLGGGGPVLPREAGGLLSASATALWLCLLLADRLDGREILGIGTVGGQSCSSSPRGPPFSSVWRPCSPSPPSAFAGSQWRRASQPCRRPDRRHGGGRPDRGQPAPARCRLRWPAGAGGRPPGGRGARPRRGRASRWMGCGCPGRPARSGDRNLAGAACACRPALRLRDPRPAPPSRPTRLRPHHPHVRPDQCALGGGDEPPRRSGHPLWPGGSR